MLNAQPDLEVVAEATRRRARRSSGRSSEDIHLAILDISMPRMTGLQAAREITQRKPEVRVLMLSMHDNEQYLFEAIRAGASGYVLKSAVDRDLVEACRAAMRGEPFLYPGAVRALMREYLERARAGEAIHGELLTPREEEIVKLVAEAHTNDEIADDAASSPRRPSSATARTSSRSSACATASSSPATRSAAAWSSRDRDWTGAAWSVAGLELWPRPHRQVRNAHQH